jgi:hypothetical protein
MPSGSSDSGAVCGMCSNDCVSPTRMAAYPVPLLNYYAFQLPLANPSSVR